MDAGAGRGLGRLGDGGSAGGGSETVRALRAGDPAAEGAVAAVHARHDAVEALLADRALLLRAAEVLQALALYRLQLPTQPIKKNKQKIKLFK